MRKRFIACLAVFAVIATMVPGVAMAATVNEGLDTDIELGVEAIPKTVPTDEGDKSISSLYYMGETLGDSPEKNLSSMINDETIMVDEPGIYRAWYDGVGTGVDYIVEDTTAPTINSDGEYANYPETNRVGMNYTIPASVSATDAGDVSITAASVTDVYYMGTELTGSPEDRVNANADGAYVLEKEGYYRAWYAVTDASGNEASLAIDFVVADEVAPSVTPIDQIKVEKGDILDIAALIGEIEAGAEDASGIKEVRLDAARYTETRASEEEIFGDEFEQLDVADIPDALEMDQVGFYEFVFAVEDNALETNTAYVPVIVEVSEIYGTAGFTINYVDKDGKAVGEPTVIEKENAVLSYGYDEDGNKITFYDFAYEQDGYVLNVPEGYYVADEKDFNGLTDPVTVFVENGGENTADEYDVIVTAVEKDAPAADEELTPPAPKTGDDMNMGLLAGLAALMVMAGTGAIVVGRKVFNK